MIKTKIVIIGAAGRDFHNFNIIFKDNPNYQVVAFTANQIPDIAGRKYPKSLAGKLYPKGIPILEEKNLEKIIKQKKVDECILSYSDLSYGTVMHLASRVVSSGAKFSILSAQKTMLKSKKPVIAIVAVRTGCGKSPVSRAVVKILKEAGKKVVLVRHPMPYGDLEKQKVQRFETIADLKKHKCTIEEMEEYEPHVSIGSIIYAGVDYGEILKQAEKEADIIIWDGGNNDTSFYVPDFTITVVDPLRPGHEIGYYPGEVNLRLADLVVINKVNDAKKEDLYKLIENIKKYNPKAQIVKTESEVTTEKPDLIKNKKVLVIEDGPTLTHGEMKTGAGITASKKYGAKQLVDPRPYVVGKIKETFKQYPNIGTLLPAMGYSNEQVKDLETTINKTKCDSVVIGTPINLERFIKINKPATRVKYEVPKEAKRQIEKILRAKKLIN